MEYSETSNRFIQYSWICHLCRTKLEVAYPFSLSCQKCEIQINFSNDTMYFSSLQNKSNDPLLKFKNILKRNNKFYDLIVWLVSPVYWNKRRIDKFKNEKRETNKLGINLGSGNSKREKGILNFEISDYPNVDVVTEGTTIPLESSSIDFILSVAVLEHANDPIMMVEEWRRVLKKGGSVFCTVPFIQGFHAAPDDFQRYTSEGLRVLFKDFEVISIKGSGSTSAMLWILQEWFVDLFGLGSKWLRLTIWFLITCVTFPLKFLDVILNRINSGSNISSFFEVELRK